MYEGKTQISYCCIVSCSLVAVYRRPKFLETLISITALCSFQVRCSLINTTKNLIEVIQFISLSLINNDESFNGIVVFLRALWKSLYLVLSLYTDNLFPLKLCKDLVQFQVGNIKRLCCVVQWKEKVCFICKYYVLKYFRFITYIIYIYYEKKRS